MAANDTSPGPILVLTVEASTGEVTPAPPEELRGYAGALIFVLSHGQLVDELSLTAPTIGLAEHISRAVAANRRPAPDRGLGRPPLVSVVIATTMSRLDELTRCLESLLRLDYPTYEVIIVDNRPTETAERAEIHRRLSRDPRVRIVSEQATGISAARNTGARAAQGELVAFTDDDVVVPPNWLRAIAYRFVQEPNTGCVTGVVLPAELATPAQIWFENSGSKLANRYEVTTFRLAARATDGALARDRFRVLVRAEHGGATRTPLYRAGTFGMGANIAFRRSELNRIGWFDEALGTGTPARGAEDIVAMVRLLVAGGQITMDSSVIVRHYHRSDLSGSLEQMRGYGVGFTAGLTALVHRDPRHLAGLAYLLGPATKVLTGRGAARASGGYPRSLARAEFAGLLLGPAAYLRSLLRRRQARRRPLLSPSTSSPSTSSSSTSSPSTNSSSPNSLAPQRKP